MLLNCPLNKAIIVYTMAEVANSKMPNIANPNEIIIMLVDTYLVEENKSNEIYIKKEAHIKKIKPGIP